MAEHDDAFIGPPRPSLADLARRHISPRFIPETRVSDQTWAELLLLEEIEPLGIYVPVHRHGETRFALVKKLEPEPKAKRRWRKKRR